MTLTSTSEWATVDDDDPDVISTAGQSLLDDVWDSLRSDEANNTPDLFDFGVDDQNDGFGVDDLLESGSSSNSTSSVDLLEETKTAFRNGDAQALSTVSQLTGILSRTGIHGPRHMKAINLKLRAVKIGTGSQFTVFRDRRGDMKGNEGLVIKRVNVPLSREDGQTFATGIEYRKQLRSLELEVLTLCNPALRNHRNIVHLVAWGYDYPFPDTPVPVLFVESAIGTLTDFLTANILGEKQQKPDDVKYQLALDVVCGLEAMHRLKIVHGDIKPDNILVFKENDESVPFCAKLSDFGVCIDMENPTGKLSVDDYAGTPAWLAPEVRGWKGGEFKPEIMLRFDSYSLGLVLMSVFTKDGAPVDLHMDGEDPVDVALYYLRENESIEPTIQKVLASALRTFLATDPWKRSLPTSDALKTDSAVYASWLWASQRSRTVAPYVGTVDPVYNRGSYFWYKLDYVVLNELEQQYAASKTQDASSFPGDVLFGMAQKVTGMKPSYLDRLVEYVTESSRVGYSPARAVYAQIIGAHGLPSRFDEVTLDRWTLQAISEGFMFATPSATISKADVESARSRFRAAGGFCVDPFLRKKNILEAAREYNHDAAEGSSENPKSVDVMGNTMLHVAATLGAADSVKCLVEEDANVSVDVQNDNGETPLYKACQAGHAEIIHYLLHQGAKASTTTTYGSVTALHWLFVLPDNDIGDIATRLVREGGASVNAVMGAPVQEGGNNFPQKITIAHFPFELPLGTPLHWAAFARNTIAIDVLLELGADINATYHIRDVSTTPLALAAWFGESDVVRYLLSKGADGTAKDGQGRNILHLMSNHLPDRHGYLLPHWHYWIRHGKWEQHLDKMSDLVQVLIGGGADLEGVVNNDHAKRTPIIFAADGGVWDGGAISAMLQAGADVNEAKDTVGYTVLHHWAATSGLHMDYPDSYLTVFQTVVARMDDVNQRDKYTEETPLHKLAVSYHPEDELERACNILLAHEKPADINATTRDGQTALYIALNTTQNPRRRGLYFAEKGASLLGQNNRGRDIFYPVAANQSLLDQQSYDLILQLLSCLASRERGHGHASGTEGGSGPDEVVHQYQVLYEKYFLPTPGAIQTLWIAVDAGRVRTTRLLLDLGLRSRINDLPDPQDQRFPQTTLDVALRSAEVARRLHMQLLSGYKSGAARERAYRDNAVYNPTRGGSAREAEAYWDMPKVVDVLLQEGARRAVDLDELDEETTARTLADEFEREAGSFWEVTAMYGYGFTPETQPHRAHWQCLYDLARYPSDWEERLVTEIKDRYLYRDGLFRPHIRLLERKLVDPPVTTVDRVLPKIIRMLASLGVPDTDKEDSVWILASDGDTGEPRWEVEIIDGKTVGRKRVIKQELDSV